MDFSWYCGNEILVLAYIQDEKSVVCIGIHIDIKPYSFFDKKRMENDEVHCMADHRIGEKLQNNPICKRKQMSSEFSLYLTLWSSSGI